MKLLFVLLFSSSALANPHWDKSKVPLDSSYPWVKKTEFFAHWKSQVSPYKRPSSATQVLRITVAWNSQSDTYQVVSKSIENSGTESLRLRAKTKADLGSYRAEVSDRKTKIIFYDSIGTGQAYRKLSRSLSFRFPLPENDFTFKMTAEHPVKGNQELVIEENISLSDLKAATPDLKDLEIYQLKKATQSPALEFVIYAEGYQLVNKAAFYQSALKAVDVLKNAQIPGFERMNFVGVFASSVEKLGTATNLGSPVVKRNSAFGLYYPYWFPLQRWYHVVYPTDDEAFRTALSVVPYDYNLVLVDSSAYWGVGNFRSHTAIPARHYSFTYLLLHEFGHYMGLNEEYDGGGPTELEFAPEIQESWSQNMSFLPELGLDKLKWKALVKDQQTPVPTPQSFWSEGRIGAYQGGYGDSHHHQSDSYKPGFSCIMDRGPDFCSVCQAGMQSLVDFDLGKSVK